MVVASVLGLTGCSKVINAIKTVHNVMHQGAAISALSNKLKTADTKAYEVSYVTTGANPVTTEYAASPPHDFAFGTTLSGKILDVISNPTGEFACSESASLAGGWTCLKLQWTDIETYKAMYALYSGAYWIDFLKLYSAAAALQGVTIHSTTMSVNGFALQCAVDHGSKTKPHQLQVVRDLSRRSSATSRCRPSPPTSRSRATPRPRRPRCSRLRQEPRSRRFPEAPPPRP